MVTRDPERTRDTLLDAGFEEIYRHGFQSARVDRILERTHVTKGAFYHHFPTKEALGHAIVDEVVRPMLEENWIGPLDGCDPLPFVVSKLRDLATTAEDGDFDCGCPLNNLAQEMAPLCEKFRARIDGVFVHWETALAAAFDQAKEAGTYRAELDSEECATFVLAAVEGAIGLAKTHRSGRPLERTAAALERHFASWRS